MSDDLDWFARARRDADRPPQRPREPLDVAIGDGADARSVRVGSVEADVAGRMAAAGLPIRRVDGSWRISEPVTDSLAAIAAWLHDAGLGGAWRNERLAVVDPRDRAVSEVERGAVRALGLTTFAVHLVGHTFDGTRVWVQQRAFDKATDPGRWDTLMGGQVAAGETVASALERETCEEAGLDAALLLDLRRGERLTIRRPVADGYQVEHVDIYTARLPAGLEPVNRDGEVERFACLDVADLGKWLARGEFTLEATLILASPTVETAARR